MTHSGTLPIMRTAMVAGHIGSAELEDLVARGARLDFRLPAASLERLAALAPANAGGAEILTASLAFQPGTEGYPQFRLVVDGAVPLVCQRCLQPLVWPVAVDVALTVVRTDPEAAGLAEPLETVVLGNDGLVPVQVVEDEVLAVLPLAPKHPDGAPCRPDDLLSPSEQHRPLAGLAELLGRTGPPSE